MKHVILAEDNQCDVTEAVQVLYDLAHASTDWGSGALDTEEMMAVVGFGVLMGWKLPDLGTTAFGSSVTVAQAFPDHYEISYEDWCQNNDPTKHKHQGYCLNKDGTKRTRPIIKAKGNQ